MPSDKKHRNSSRKSHQHRTHKQLDASNSNQMGVPTPGLIDGSSRHSPRRNNTVANVEDIKNRAFRTEELTQRAHRFNFQLAIDLREKLQSEFDALERFSADPRSTVLDLKVAVISLSNKMISEIDKQMDVQKKIAEAYRTMHHESAEMAKKVLTELDNARLSVDETADATRLLRDVMDVIKETVEYWINRPEVSLKKLTELKRDTPRDSMSLVEMFERLEFQVKHCHKALEHPMAGVVSISKDFAKLNIDRKS